MLQKSIIEKKYAVTLRTNKLIIHIIFTYVTNYYRVCQKTTNEILQELQNTCITTIEMEMLHFRTFDRIHAVVHLDNIFKFHRYPKIFEMQNLELIERYIDVITSIQI